MNGTNVRRAINRENSLADKQTNKQTDKTEKLSATALKTEETEPRSNKAQIKKFMKSLNYKPGLICSV